MGLGWRLDLAIWKVFPNLHDAVILQDVDGRFSTRVEDILHGDENGFWRAASCPCPRRYPQIIRYTSASWPQNDTNASNGVGQGRWFWVWMVLGG